MPTSLLLFFFPYNTDDVYDEGNDSLLDMEGLEPNPRGEGYILALAIPPAFHGFIVGYKGATRMNIEKETKCHLRIPPKGQAGSISQLEEEEEEKEGGRERGKGKGKEGEGKEGGREGEGKGGREGEKKLRECVIDEDRLEISVGWGEGEEEGRKDSLKDLPFMGYLFLIHSL